jgi:hypothetical protein
MLRPLERNYEIYLGSTFRDRFSWNWDNGNPVDLTDAIIRMEVRPNLNSCEIIFSLSTENGKIVVDPENPNTFDIVLSHQETGAVDYRLYKGGVYDLEIEINGSIYILLVGKMKFKKQVTRGEVCP